MPLTQKQTRIRGLYGITDPTLIPADKLLDAIEQAILGGARIIQYRNKSATKDRQYQEASQLSQLCKQYNVCFIINDDPQLALAVAADGVHVGKEDGKITDARKLLGKQAIIGVSCYNQLENAHRAIKQGADYIAFGRFFNSNTKPNALKAEVSLLQQAAQHLEVPIVAIGGIRQDNARQLIDNGADAVAVIHDLFQNHKKIYQAAHNFQILFS